MLPELQENYELLQRKKLELLDLVQTLSPDHLNFKPDENSWSVMQNLQHIVIAERGMRLTEAELRDHPLRSILEPGQLFGVVRDILEKDVPVEVPDPSLYPDPNPDLESIIDMWHAERLLLFELLETITTEALNLVTFSHPAAGPITPTQMLDLGLVHFDTHERAIRKLLFRVPSKEANLI
jgi:hypothetical protein